jgi:hypothetical protein
MKGYQRDESAEGKKDTEEIFYHQDTGRTEFGRIRCYAMHLTASPNAEC